MAVITLRHTIWNLVPTWLRRWNAFTVLYAICLVGDALWDMLVAAVKIRFQGLYSDESLPRIGAERRMVQGRIESVQSYALRLGTWWDVAKHSGDFFTLAKQVRDYCLPSALRVEIVCNNGTRYKLGTDGSWSVDSVSWNWDGRTDLVSRFWVLLYNDVLGMIGTNHLVLDGASTVLQSTRLVGSDATDSTSSIGTPKAIHDIVETYRAPHTHCVHIMPILDETNFWLNPPAGNWQYWKNRNNYALYWSGT